MFVRYSRRGYGDRMFEPGNEQAQGVAPTVCSFVVRFGAPPYFHKYCQILRVVGLYSAHFTLIASEQLQHVVSLTDYESACDLPRP